VSIIQLQVPKGMAMTVAVILRNRYPRLPRACDECRNGWATLDGDGVRSCHETCSAFQRDVSCLSRSGGTPGCCKRSR
jgi:hypothetical protein